MNIAHLQWEFPLAKTVNLNICASTFNVLFRTKHITLPVFQRKYCWTTSQFKLFWKDLIKLSSSFKSHKHHIGKVTVFEKGDEIIVIDGQQRITTVLIICMSIRDAFIRINETRKSRKIRNMVDKIESVLFNSADSINLPKAKDKSKAQLSTCDEKSDIDVGEGDRVRHIRFLPTYLDRQPFYNLVLRNKAQKSNDSVVNIYAAKQYFDACVDSLCRNGSLQRLCVLYVDLMPKFTFVYTGIPHQHADKGFFIYQWLFEKQFLAATLLQNKRPGEHHLPCEMFNNYILSFFIALDIEHQERVYLQWNAMEKKFASMREFNAFLVGRVEAEESGEFYVYRELAKLVEAKLKGVQETDYPVAVQQYLDALEAEIDGVGDDGNIEADDEKADGIEDQKDSHAADADGEKIQGLQALVQQNQLPIVQEKSCDKTNE